MSLHFYLPLLTYPDPTTVSGVVTATEFAALVQGSLHISSHVVDIPPIINPLARAFVDYSGIANEAQRGSVWHANDLTKVARRQAMRLRLTTMLDTFRMQPEALGEFLATAARSHDAVLLVVDADSKSHRAVAEAMLFGSGGPVVLLPAALERIKLDQVAIAWDGGRASARAVRDALPLFRLARRITILTAGDEKPIEPTSTARLTAYLNRHGIATAHREVAAAARPVGDTLQAEAVACDADLLVMGAYGRHWLREFVLGGATRSVLAGLVLPTLMAH